jgi:hypothetical protein
MYFQEGGLPEVIGLSQRMHMRRIRESNALDAHQLRFQ